MKNLLIALIMLVSINVFGQRYYSSSYYRPYYSSYYRPYYSSYYRPYCSSYYRPYCSSYDNGAEFFTSINIGLSTFGLNIGTSIENIVYVDMSTKIISGIDAISLNTGYIIKVKEKLTLTPTIGMLYDENINDCELRFNVGVIVNYYISEKISIYAGVANKEYFKCGISFSSKNY